VVSIMEVLPQDEIMLITKHGVIIRSSVAEVRLTGRNAQGVKLVNLDGGDLLMAVARLVPDDKPDGEVPAGVDDGPDDEGDDGEDDE